MCWIPGFNRGGNRRAFTLMEMLVTVLLLGILTGIAIVNYRGYQDRVAVLTDEANLKILHTALKIQATETGSLPASLSALPAHFYNQTLKTIRCPADASPPTGFSGGLPTGGTSYELSTTAASKPISWLMNPANANEVLIGERDSGTGPPWVDRHKGNTVNVRILVSGQTEAD